MNTTTLPESAPPGLSVAAIVGVKTTGIYCRPDCRPGRLPKPENCIPFESVQAAREAGYRACKKCRPDGGVLETIRYGHRSTPLGVLFGAVSARGLCALDLLDDEETAPALARLRSKFPGAELVEGSDDLGAWLELAADHVLSGKSCDGISLDLRGTPFQRRVWDALRAIPRGQTVTYGELARSLGMAPGAARAVGSACGKNPVTLVVPCHRVVGHGGGLGGYYWGLDRKKAILDAEALPG